MKVVEKGWAGERPEHSDVKTSAKTEATLGETRHNNLRCSKQQAPATVVFRGLTFDMSGRPRYSGGCPLEGRVSPRPVPALNEDAR